MEERREGRGERGKRVGWRVERIKGIKDEQEGEERRRNV
jgi:hypothetical protein